MSAPLLRASHTNFVGANETINPRKRTLDDGLTKIRDLTNLDLQSETDTQHLDRTLATISSKRAMSFVGGVDRLRQDISQENARVAQDVLLKTEHKSIYNAWKEKLLENAELARPQFLE
jgi:hypothetical protein